MFFFRQAKTSDLEDLLELANSLGSAGSLPTQSENLKEFIDISVASFAQSRSQRESSKYLFVLEDSQSSKVVGSSLLYGKLGFPGKPHISLKVLYKDFKDASTKLSFRHQLLRFQFDEDGPSGIGGLILDPKLRGSGLGLGRFLSFARFLYAKIEPERFEESVLAELLPPFREDGGSELWEAFGKRFTGLEYAEADQLSRTNKDFIRNLFPKDDIYTSLFTPEARAVIGKTGESTRAAEKLLRHIGFRYLETVDPFDGGPYFGAKFSELSLVQSAKWVSLSSGALSEEPRKALVAYQGPEGFESIQCSLCLNPTEETAIIPEDIEGFLRSRSQNFDGLFLVTLL